MKKVLVDTNILIYAFDEASQYHDICKNLINTGNNLYTAHNNLLEFYRVLTSKVYLKNYSLEIVEQAFSFLKQKLTILYPTEITDIILADSINEFSPKSGQIFDFLILAQAIENNLNYIYTYNIQDFPKLDDITISQPVL